MTLRHAFRRAIALIAVFILGTSCQEDGLSPHDLRSSLEPVFPDSAAPLGSGSVPTPPNNNVSYAWQNTQISLPTGVAIKVTARGKLHFDVNPGFEPCAHNPPPSIPSDVGPAGLNTPNRPYAVLTGIGTATNAPSSANSVQPPLDVNSDSTWSFVTGPGVLWVERPTVVVGACQGPGTGYQPAYFVSGGQTVDATVLPPPTIDVDKQTIVHGDTVSAHPVSSWSTNILVWGGWTWINDNGSNAGATFVPGSGCLSRSLTCKVIPHGDGHLYMPSLTVSGIGQTAVSPVIHVAAAHLTLVVDSSHVASGSQVRFTARRTDNQPVSVDSWVWTPQAGSPPGPVAAECAGDSVCVTTLVNTTPATAPAPQTGTMTAWATFGTASLSASVSVTVDPPPVDSGGACGGSAPISGSTRIVSHSGPIATVCYPPPPGGTVSLVLVMNHDTLNALRPRIRGMTVNSITVPEGQPDTASVQVSVAQDGAPVPAGTPVTVRAEWLPNTGGHAHLQTVLRFESSTAPRLTQGPEQGKPLMGYFFVSASDKRASFSGVTNASSAVETKLVAGYLSGRARIIASVAVAGQTVADTVIVAYAVPGLIKLQDSMPEHVYWIGGTTYHHQGDNFYVQDSIDQRLSSIAISMKGVVSGDSVFLQYNDASLPAGGTFTVYREPVVYEDPFKVEPEGHQSHNTGLDQDIGWCYAKYHGDDGQVHRLNSAGCKSPGGNTSLAVSLIVLRTYACAQHGAPEAHSNNHYHIRFAGSTDAMPVSLCPNP